MVCRYDGLNGVRFTLRATARLDPAAAGRLARAIRQIPLSHTIGGVTNCPMDDGAFDLFAFGYDGEADVDIWCARTGCSTLANDRIVTRGHLDPTLYAAAFQPVPVPR